jgi:prepilin-type N-terminal cleavage/methylation domain-containing protein
MPLKYSQSQEHGFSLFELLLVVAISAVLIMTTIQTFDFFTKREVNVLAAQHILQVQNAGEEYVSANFTDILTNDVPAVGDVARINTNVLAAAGFLPVGFDNANAFKQLTTLFVRNAGTNFTGGATLEVITVSENRAAQDNAFPAQRVVDAATSAGSKVGVVVDLDTGANCCENAIQSYNGSWSLPLTVLTVDADIPPAWTAVAARPQRGYLAAYGRIAFSNTFNGDYLYRVAIDGQPELNRMETNIDMANNDINGVGVAAADNLTVGYAYDPATGLYSDRVVGGAGTGNFLIQGRRTGTGNFTPFALSVDNALQAEDGTSTFGFRNVPGACEVDAAGNVVVGNSTACAGGDLVMNNGSLQLNRLTLGSGIASGTTPSFFGARNMTVNGDINNANRNFTANFDDGDPNTFDDVTVNFTTTTNDLTAFTMDTSAAGTFDTPNLQASGARFQNNVTAEKVVIGEATNIGTLQTTGNSRVEGDLESSGNLNARNIIASETMLIRNMNSCHWDQRASGNVWYCPNTGCYRVNSTSPWVCP